MRNMIKNDLYNRPTSSFPVSLPTGLALETLFTSRLPVYDPDRPIPKRVNLSSYQTAWINIWTLYRNLISSFDKNTFLTLRVNDLVGALAAEVEVIQSLFAIEGLGVCKPIFYFCSYKDLAKLDPRIRLREDKTELQIAQKDKYLATIKQLESMIHLRMLNTNLMPESRTSSLIMTHVPYDLLSHSNFSRLDLLESNTGKLKTRLDWNSKYYQVSGFDMSQLPFLKMLLLILGDRVLIHPADTKLRRLVLQMAEDKKWTPATTISKIVLDLELAHIEPYVLTFLKTIK